MSDDCPKCGAVMAVDKSRYLPNVYRCPECSFEGTREPLSIIVEKIMDIDSTRIGAAYLVIGLTILLGTVGAATGCGGVPLWWSFAGIVAVLYGNYFIFREK